MIKCSECGYENIDGLDYCDGCGAKLNAAAPAQAGESGAAASEAAAHPAPAEAAAEAPAEAPATPPPSETPTGEIKPPAEANAAATAAAPAAEAPAAAAGATARAKLQVVRGGRKGQEFPLEDGNNLVGRWDPETGAFPEVDLDQDDPEAEDLTQARADPLRGRQDHGRGYRQSQRHLCQSPTAPDAWQPGRAKDG